MQLLKPIVHETVWGGDKLAPYCGNVSTRIGHLYSAIDTDDFCNTIIAGSAAGKSLHEWYVENQERYGLQRYAQLPILMALVEARENLSIQVHPNDEMAAKLVGHAHGKNESFYTLIAPTCGKMYNGCKASGPAEMSDLMQAGRIEDALDMMPCAVGDYIYIEGGTLHAATAGSLHFEIEENCEVTYRFWDYDRVDANGQKRPLQVKEALSCLDASKKSVTRHYTPGEPIHERMYSTQLVSGQDSYTNEGDMFAFAVMLSGEKTYSIAPDTPVLPGTALILDPGETLDTAGASYMIAIPKR